MQYRFIQDAGVRAPGQRDQLPHSSLQGAISIHLTDPGSPAISHYTPCMGFLQVQVQKKMYTEWWNCAKDQMIARGFAPGGRMARVW